jgi:hypothetical protein
VRPMNCIFARGAEVSRYGALGRYESVARLVRGVVGVLLLLTSVGLVVGLRTTSGAVREGVEYLAMQVLALGVIGLLVLLAMDLVAVAVVALASLRAVTMKDIARLTSLAILQVLVLLAAGYGAILFVAKFRK